jgi:carotenoid cleavage dioxygenase-like enzyme
VSSVCAIASYSTNKHLCACNAGEMFTFGYSQTPPYITYRVISKDGYMHDPVPITISYPIMMHDFAITENNAIFMDLPVYFRPKVLQVFLLM